MEIKINQDVTLKQGDYLDSLFDNEGKIKADEKTEFYFFGGFGSGKSRIVNTSVNLICQTYPGAHGVFIRESYPELSDSVIPQYLSYFPPLEHGYTYNKSARECEYLNGTRLDFRAFDRDTKILSNEYDFIAFSQLEEIPHELFLQALGRNRRKVGGLPKNIILAEGNPASGWVKERLKDQPLKQNMVLIEAKTRENPFLPPEYEKNLRANYPAFWAARYLDGEWTNLDEMVFSEFREHDTVINPVSTAFCKNFKQLAGMDYGWVNPTAVVWGYIDYDGELTIYDEWGGTQKIAAEIAESAKRHGKIRIVADYSIKRPDRDGRSLWDDLTQQGLWLEESNKQELENITLVNALMKNGRIKITRNCVELLKEIQNYKWKKMRLGEQKNRPEEPVQKDNHYIDALLYLVASLEELRSVDVDQITASKRSISYLNTRKPMNMAVQRNS